MQDWDEFEELIDEANELFENCLLEDAKELLEEIEERFPKEPETAFQLALILEREPGKELEAQRLFKFAYEKDPETFHMPIKISNEELNKLAHEVLAKIKEPFKSDLKNLPIFIEELPSDDDLEAGEDPLSPSIWGLFKGRTAVEDQDLGGASHLEPAKIVIYRRNLCRDCADMNELKKELKITILHEVAHYFGLDEDEVSQLGLA